MIILFQIFDGENRYDLGKIENGKVTEEIEDGFEEWIRFETSLPTTPDLEDEAGLLRAYEGPHIVAQIVD
ncbi:hypothetical protein GS429_20660 [Natronorubrum sp. JWXQ-INN-674]|uniref:Uncharacterized protein n=1 Tax=Natronorubrum halalkaliphilum TaxID=2691917 RepID=A0A6B0VSR3_9EURY|nr:hypothetical protein [Natronorubrum halalkaliphilum]MXV64435.1 hypothetical protein [Natronorubrum halalkaliphilum]